MKVKVRVSERATYFVTLDVEDPDDHDQLVAAWTNVPVEVADRGIAGYDDREIEVIDLLLEPDPVERLAARLQEERIVLEHNAQGADEDGRHEDAEQIRLEAYGFHRALMIVNAFQHERTMGREQ